MEETLCEIVCGAPTTLAVKGWLLIIMMEVSTFCFYHSEVLAEIPSLNVVTIWHWRRSLTFVSVPAVLVVEGTPSLKTNSSLLLP